MGEPLDATGAAAGTVAGLDVGGAHVKAARLTGGRVVAVTQIASPLWQGIDRLAAALAEAKAFVGDARRVGVVVTAELADTFDSRRDGVARVAALVGEGLRRGGGRDLCRAARPRAARRRRRPRARGRLGELARHGERRRARRAGRPPRRHRLDDGGPDPRPRRRRRRRRIHRRGAAGDGRTRLHRCDAHLADGGGRPACRSPVRGSR
jgi:hypothetical protein